MNTAIYNVFAASRLTNNGCVTEIYKFWPDCA
jgi:hypothetical protein